MRWWLNTGCASGQCPIQSCGEDGHVPELLEKVADHVQHHGDGDRQAEKAEHGLGDGVCG